MRFRNLYKQIGIVGGLSPESTMSYYQYLVRRYQELFGDHSYPEIVIYSVNFQRYITWTRQEKWEKVAEDLTRVIARLQVAGVDFAVIACNMVHFVFDQVQEKASIPLLSIIDATAEAIRDAGITTVGLLGTRFTMENNFYRTGLARHGIKSLIPKQSSRISLTKIILEELARGLIKSESRNKVLTIIEDLVGKGASGIVLGCTEIPLLINAQHSSVKLFDTAAIHADKALELGV